MALRLQIAGGLALSKVKHARFQDILVPAAKTLLLTGDCLEPGKPINKDFKDYLTENWTRILYIPGKLERTDSSDRAILPDDPKIRYVVKGLEQSIGYGADLKYYKVFAMEGPKQEEWLYDTLQDHREGISIISSYEPASSDAITGAVGAIIYGQAHSNRFDTRWGPVTNHRTCPQGHLRKCYKPDFVLTFGEKDFCPTFTVATPFIAID